MYLHLLWKKTRCIRVTTMINKHFKFFFAMFFYENEASRQRKSCGCYHGNKSATYKKGILVHPPWVPNFLQNVKGGWKSFISKDVWISQTSSKSAWREEWQQPKDAPVIYNKIFSTGKKYNFQLNFKRNLFVSSNFFISATLD